MHNTSLHRFHIPVMGLAYTIDSPLKCARFGISSVVSIVEDNLIEEMRKFWCNELKVPYIPILKDEEDGRARRITAYLDLLDDAIKKQVDLLRREEFLEGNEIVKYFELLPADSPVRQQYERTLEINDPQERLQALAELRKEIRPGAIDVNIMTKCDRTNYARNGEPLPANFTDAMAALRGYANSKLQSSIVFSAGINMRLFSYCEQFPDFFPGVNGIIIKNIIIKVSDYRSALIQGKILAKKGLWVSEYRIESGLNCGGHAFATEGFLLGPVLEEFKLKKNELEAEQESLCRLAFARLGKEPFPKQPPIRISVQGGVGTARENDFLLRYYQTDSVGWGSPFLLVPEVTNVDQGTLQRLTEAKPSDYYLSNASPLGVLFNNLRTSSAEEEKRKRISKGKPGSPCYNKYLAFDTEFTDRPICTASRVYQRLKIDQLKRRNLSSDVLNREIARLTEKECICQGLGTAFFLKNNIPGPHKIKAVSICPGPNLAYFSRKASLREMLDHIYGRENILNDLPRPHMFINELHLYLDFFKNETIKLADETSTKEIRYLVAFKDNLLAGISYYLNLARVINFESVGSRLLFIAELITAEKTLLQMEAPVLQELKAC